MSETRAADAASAPSPQASAVPTGLTILGSPDAVACEGDACLIPVPATPPAP